jgi:hypothetical protein
MIEGCFYLWGYVLEALCVREVLVLAVGAVYEISYLWGYGVPNIPHDSGQTYR